MQVKTYPCLLHFTSKHQASIWSYYFMGLFIDRALVRRLYGDNEHETQSGKQCTKPQDGEKSFSQRKMRTPVLFVSGLNPLDQKALMLSRRRNWSRMRNWRIWISTSPQISECPNFKMMSVVHKMGWLTWCNFHHFYSFQDFHNTLHFINKHYGQTLSQAKAKWTTVEFYCSKFSNWYAI